ncbi:MAG: peptide deformylase [Clostridia bacterium]|nr:peptide deformylase [Clostridia bacterium]
MAVLNIVKEGDPTLRKVCRPVTEITPRILTLLDDMKDTLHRANGVGLAAPQVGVLRRIVLVECEEGDLIELINPEIIERSDEIQEEVEGCLSIPNRWGITRRPARVTVRAMDRTGKTFTVSGEDLKARAFCHEIDHLDGILFTDRTIRYLDPDEIG